MTEFCGAVLRLWDSEYEGECEKPPDHEPPHFDGMTSWSDDEDGSTDYDTVVHH